jgi:hypothetical protein
MVAQEISNDSCPRGIDNGGVINGKAKVNYFVSDVSVDERFGRGIVEGGDSIIFTIDYDKKPPRRGEVHPIDINAPFSRIVYFVQKDERR